MPYLFFKPLMVRTPLYSYQNYAVENLSQVVADPQFQKALYLANPVFYKLLEAKGFDAGELSLKELQTLLKYYNRMCFRCTPLGLFASFSLTQWADEQEIILSDDVLLHARVDHKTAVDLAQSVVHRQLLTEVYLLNPCIYRVYKGYRFVKTTQPAEGDKLVFAIESIDRNVFTSQLLKFCGKRAHTGAELANFIQTKTGCAQEEAIDYIQFLIEAQVLRAQTDVNLTGPDYLGRLLQGDNLTPAMQKLVNANVRLTDTKVPLNELKKIADTIADVSPGTAKNSNYFYSVSERKMIAGAAEISFQQQITAALEALRKLTNQQPNANLTEFIKQFKVKYDQQKVPLLHAVDPEIGIGYSNVTRHAHNLMPEGAWKKQKENGPLQLQWSAVHRLFMQLWCGRPHSNTAIEITEEHLKTLTVANDLKLPPSIAVMFRRVDKKIIMESAGGASALGLIGRFSLFSNDVEQICHQVAEVEQQTNPGVLFAEVAQLSNLHVDNINRRKHTYGYEIPINAVSTLPANKQLALSDLWLSVVNDELMLESEKLKMRIVPRLSSAYNVLNNDLGVFRLLADLQNQGLKGSFNFTLEALFPGLEFYPRVQYQNTILCLAVWNLGADFIASLKKLTTAPDELRLFQELQHKWQLPRHIAISRADQFLVFDLEKADEVLFLLSCIKSLKTLRLQEYIPDNSAVVATTSGPLASQYVALLYQTESVYAPLTANKRSALYQLKRTHIIGSEWLYLKLYCDQAFADTLLAKKIFPQLKQLQKQEMVKDWFFIRYTDTGYHIRLRLRLNNGAQGGQVLRLFKEKLADMVHYRLIKEYQADTYQPELERYGPDVMLEVEDFFYRSSELITAYISATLNVQQPFSRYGFALVTVNDMADEFIESSLEKAGFYERIASFFYNEFADDKRLRVEMDNAYRNARKDIAAVFAGYNQYRNLKLATLYGKFKTSVKQLSAMLTQATDARRQQLLSDIIHMHVNRIFTINQRQQELLTYYFLAKYMQSVNAMQKEKLKLNRAYW